MKNIFEQSTPIGCRYDRYELRVAEDGRKYITPGRDAGPMFTIP